MSRNKSRAKPQPSAIRHFLRLPRDTYAKGKKGVQWRERGRGRGTPLRTVAALLHSRSAVNIRGDEPAQQRRRRSPLHPWSSECEDAKLVGRLAAKRRNVPPLSPAPRGNAAPRYRKPRLSRGGKEAKVCVTDGSRLGEEKGNAGDEEERRSDFPRWESKHVSRYRHLFVPVYRRTRREFFISASIPLQIQPLAPYTYARLLRTKA